MGFLKKLGRFAKKAVKVGVSSGLVPGLGTVGGVIASKLQTAGENRRKLALARKGELVKKPTTLLQTAGAKRVPPPAWQRSQKPAAAKAIQVRGEGAALLASSIGAKREATRKASLERLEGIKSLEAKIAKLTAGQKEDLANEFTRSGGGTPAQFRQFLAARL